MALYKKQLHLSVFLRIVSIRRLLCGNQERTARQQKQFARIGLETTAAWRSTALHECFLV